MFTQTQKIQNSARSKPVSSNPTTMPQNSHPVLQLQRKIGNQAVQSLVQSLRIQAKLTVGAPNDKYEQEADRVADQIMRMPEPIAIGQAPSSAPKQTPAIQRLCTECEDELQRQSLEEIDEEEDKMLQAKEMSGQTPEVSSELEGTINSLRGGGKPLSPSDRRFFEPRFGQDFSQVRIHADTKAAETAKAVNARAFTLGKNIVFGSGEYSPETGRGRQLLAHELTHTIQQGAVSPVGKAPSSDRDYQRPWTSHGHITKTDLHLQRQAENLRATRFSGNRILERAFDNRTTVSQQRNRRGIHVRLLQQSLLAQGYALPVHGVDNIFGPETEAAVRAFQIDAGAVLLDGIVGPETMRLFDMHDPGATTGVPAVPAAPAAVGAVFSEAATEQFAGYDASTAPDWLVVPVGGRRRSDVAIAPAGARPTFVSDTPGVATVDTTRTGIAVTGISHGTTRIRARQGAAVLDTLRVSVKNRLNRSVAFHYVCDSRPAAAGGPHCSNGTPSANAMRSLLNRVWHRQANVRFTGGAAHNVVVPGNLGPAVDWTTALPGGGEWATVIATGTGANYNVFRVWRYMQNGVWPNDAANLVNNTLIGDNPCADGWGLPHECGHFLGLGHGSGFIMTPCGGRINQRVSKAMVDIVNP